MYGQLSQLIKKYDLFYVAGLCNHHLILIAYSNSSIFLTEFINLFITTVYLTNVTLDMEILVHGNYTNGFLLTLTIRTNSNE